MSNNIKIQQKRKLAARRREPVACGRTELVTTITLSSGKFTQGVNYNISGVMAALSAVYRWYRIKHLRVAVYPGSLSQAIVFQYVPGGGSSTSGASDGTMEGQRVGIISSSQTVPTIMIVDVAGLEGQLTWYATQFDASDEYLETCGYIHFEGDTSQSFKVKYEIDYEFKETMAEELALSSASLKNENLRLKRALLPLPTTK
jgi:hypothetical protein